MFWKKKKRKYEFNKYVISKTINTFKNGDIVELFYVSTKDTDGNVDEYMYSPIVKSYSECYECVDMLNDIKDYKSNRFIINIKSQDGCLYYGVFDTFIDSEYENKTFNKSESVIEYLESIEIVNSEYIKEVIE